MKQYFLPILLLVFSTTVLGQQLDTTAAQVPASEDSTEVVKLRHFRIGAKLGFPNVVGGGIEIVLPILNNRIAPYLDFSGFTLNIEDDVSSALSYREIGANFYFGQQARGLYLAAGAGSLETDFTFKDLSLNNGVRGRGSVVETINTLNFKIGVKSKGRFYFRFELGYGFGTIPEEITLNATGTTSSGQTITETVAEPIPALPGVNANGILIGNIGFGFSF